MDNSYSYVGFQSVFRHPEKKHKNKPTQFTSVAGGTKIRHENNLKYRKSCRLSVIDNARNLDHEQSTSPVRLSEAQLKLEQRLQKMEKWKEEKAKLKKEQASQKKKPFLTGILHAPLNKCIAPPTSKEKPSISGRVMRSQARSQVSKLKAEEKPATKTFAPKNATFRPPNFRTPISTVPTLISNTQKNSKANIKMITFDPVVPKSKVDTLKISKSNHNSSPMKDSSSSRSARLTARNARNNQTNESNKVAMEKVLKSPKKLKKITKKTTQSSTSVSSSSNDLESKNTTDSSTKPVSKTRESPILSKTQRLFSQKSQVTPKTRVPRSESSSEERLRSPKNLLQMTPQQFAEEVTRISPSVTLSRGKDNARKEIKRKMDEGLLDEDNSGSDSVQHFRRQHASEVARITAVCDKWDEIYEKTSLPEFVQELVLGACGMARLLISSKMQQFADLVERCAARDAVAGAGLVLPADLHGFWDMLFIQIENVDMRFKKLEEMRARDWAEEVPPPAPAQLKQQPARARAVRAARGRRPKPAAAQSRIREMITAVRCAQRHASPGPATPSPAAAAAAEKVFDAGFFCVRSPVGSPRTPRSTRPARASLLQCVLSSEATKVQGAAQNSASCAMLRASILSKNIDIEGVSPLKQTPKQLPFIDLNATPARSILKVTQPADSVKKYGKKSGKTVLFDELDTEANDSAEKKRADSNTDSGVSMDVNKDNDKENKENCKRKSKLTRQEAVEETSPVMTRARRKSIQTPQLDDEKTTKRSSRKMVLQEPEKNIEKSRRKKSGTEEVPKPTRRRSNRNSDRNRIVAEHSGRELDLLWNAGDVTIKRGKTSAGEI